MANFHYVKQDLFDMPHGVCFAHCISEDFALGAGIAVDFDKRYNMRDRLNRKCDDRSICNYVGSAIKIDNVFNLVTKTKCYDKPTYRNLQKALQDMAQQIDWGGIKSLAMPKIGAGLDKLRWEIVLAMIKNEFKQVDVTITICFLDDDPDFDKCENIKPLDEYLKEDFGQKIFGIGEDVEF